MATATHDRLLLRIGDAAEVLSVGRSTIYELVSAGELPVIHVGRAVRIPAAAVQQWVERRQVAEHFQSVEVNDGAE